MKATMENQSMPRVTPPPPPFLYLIIVTKVQIIHTKIIILSLCAELALYV